VWPLSLTGRIIRRPPPCASATGRCWRRPSSAGLTRRALHPADGSLMPLPAPWIARRRV
ncbi:carbamoyltransferase hypF, partial [Klebsiella pneumoniae]